MKILNAMVALTISSIVLSVGGSLSAQDLSAEQSIHIDRIEALEKVSKSITSKGVGNAILNQKEQEIETVLQQAKQQIIIDGTGADEVVINATKQVYLKITDATTDKVDLRDELGDPEDNLSVEKTVQVALEGVNSKQNQTYTLFVSTQKSFAELKQSVERFDPSATLTQFYEQNGQRVYRIVMSHQGLLALELLQDIMNGTIPETFLGMAVVMPQVFSLDQVVVTHPLEGEAVNQLRGLEDYQSHEFASYLASRPRVRVGVIDSGIQEDHPDLRDNISHNIPSVNFINDGLSAQDAGGHGTHVAGTIGASINGFGVYGVNPSAELVNLRVCDAYCPSYAIYNAVKYAIDNGIQVINLSLGGKGQPVNDPLCLLITQAKQQGVITVVAAGNNNRRAEQKVPAGCPHSITVSAVSESHTRASFSNYGPAVTVAAPGVSIFSTYLNSGYAYLNGTSMASPYIAGLVSAMLAVDPTLDYQEIVSLLQTHSTPMNTSPGKEIKQFAQMVDIMTALGFPPIGVGPYVPPQDVTAPETTTPIVDNDPSTTTSDNQNNRQPKRETTLYGDKIKKYNQTLQKERSSESHTTSSAIIR